VKDTVLQLYTFIETAGKRWMFLRLFFFCCIFFIFGPQNIRDNFWKSIHHSVYRLLVEKHQPISYIGPMEDPRPFDLYLANACSFKSALCSDSCKLACAWRYLAKLRAAISSASSICFLYVLILP